VDFRLKQFDFMVFEVEGVTEFFFGLGGVGNLELFAPLPRESLRVVAITLLLKQLNKKYLFISYPRSRTK
jgi:hypothetical protein